VIVKRREDVAESPLPGTTRRLVLSYDYKRARFHPRQIVSPLQSEFRWFLRVVDRQKELARCELRAWTGEFEAVSVAPDASVAAVRWSDQTEAGLVLVDLAGMPRQRRAAWDTRETNWIEGPVWTPDSQLLVLVENPSGAGPWWAQHEPGEADDEDRSPGGTFSPGSLVVLDIELRERFRSELEVELPAGWFPAGDADRGLQPPQLLSSSEAVVRVPALGDLAFEFRA
jgi:hypothetical protein